MIRLPPNLPLTATTLPITARFRSVRLLAARLAGPGREPLSRSHLISRETALSMVGMGLGIALMIESDLGRLPEGVVAVPLASEADDALVPLTARSEEHTSELQSLMRISYAVFCLKKKKHKKHQQC